MKLTFLQLHTLLDGFSMLLHGGIPLPDGAAFLAGEAEGPLRQLLSAIAGDLDEGLDLARAMDRSGAFPAYAVTMVELGEQTGLLEDVLSELAAFYEERQRLTDALRSAFFYPGVILGLMLVVVGVLLIWVLPVFDSVYASLGSGMTGVAGTLLTVGIWLKGSLPVLFGLLTLTAVVGFACLRSPSFREKVSRQWNARFGDRGISRNVNNARFLRGIAMGMKAGLLPDEAARNACRLLDEIPGAADRSGRCLASLEEGRSLPEGLLENGFLSGSAAGLLRIGIRSGSALPAVEKLAQAAAGEAEAAVDRMLQRIEPAMVLMGSGLVGVILLSVMAPLINILSLIG